MIENVDYHITDDCNLNCISCNHFCPISIGGNKSLSQIKSDLYLLSKFRDNIKQISIMGGEPTLHPDLREILEFVRTIFPFNEILLVSNGIAINKLIAVKEVMIKNKIFLHISKYPFKENYQRHYDNIYKEFNDLYINYYLNPDEGITAEMQVKPLAYRKISSPEDILNCRMRVCSQLKNGKLYLCNIIAGFEDFDNAFKGLHTIQNDNSGYIDLNTCVAEDLDILIEKSVPTLCYYCKECKRWLDCNMENVKWTKSSRNIDEWYDTNEQFLSEHFT